jgi:HEAT repeat protein
MNQPASRDQLLQELAAISPMPDDETLAATPGLDQRYHEILNALWDVADESCIEPLLESFGYGYGFEVYELAEAILISLPPDRVRPSLLAALREGAAGSRMWAARILAAVGRAEDGEALLEALDDPKPLVRKYAAEALGRLGVEAAAERLREALDDPSLEVQLAAETALRRLEEEQQ